MTVVHEQSSKVGVDGTKQVSDLTPQMVVPKEFQEQYTRSLASWSASLQPQDAFQRFHLGQAVLASIRVENSQAAEIQRKTSLAEIAADPGPRWDRNREYEARQRSTSLKRNPAKIQAELEHTFAGRAWLLTQWNRLAFAVPSEGESHWTEALTQEVFDLMGIAKAYRPALVTARNTFVDPKVTRQLILSQISGLNALQECLAAENAELRALHCQGIGLENDVNVKQSRRFEADAQRLLTRSLKTIKQAQSVSDKPKIAKPKIAPCVEKVAKVQVADKSETPIGNRRFRRKLEAAARREAHRARQMV